ncbi:CoA transferase subunit A [Ancylobacter sonchi]|uniref:CoA transferase subunit A n=1 Tax=Ancylobacter sonchi TaxID=1937790 RepID=UPI001BD5450B|nr:CoA-transferase [Ancylobacter sonchi]MBS7532488.1 CoA transferase subunit A [Ancylobacter sonchi]
MAATTLAQAVRDHVDDGATVFVGGFGHCVPFASGHEIIRQGKRNLTLTRTGADILIDQLIAGGCVARLIVGYVGNPGIGLAHAFRRALEAGSLTLEEWTNFTLTLRFHAGRIGVPFLPTRALRAGDMPKHIADLATLTCPYTGALLTAVPGLCPDVALVHAQRADEDGNVQLWGIDGDTCEGALASRRIIATVEEIVPAERVRRSPELTVLPAHRVTALCVVPGGAHPSYVHGYYTRDDARFAEYDRLSRRPDDLDAFLAAHVHGVADREAYLGKLPISDLSWPVHHGPGGRQ